MLERKLKLLIARKDLAKVFQARTVADSLRSAPERKRIRSSHFDTPGQDLRRAGVELSVHRRGRQRVQTVKVVDAGVMGMHVRRKQESQVAGDALELGKIEDAPSVLRDPEIQGRVGKVFETQFWRRQGTWDCADGSAIEIRVDSGRAIVGERSAPICEVALELKQGSPDAVYELAEALAARIDLRLSAGTKSDLGYRLLDEFKPKPVFAQPTKLAGETTREDIFIRLLTESVEHAFANEEAVLDSSDVEGVHQMRVGLRRFRSVLGVFKPVIPASSREAAMQTVKPLLAALGPARDWDVFLTEQVALMRRALPHADPIDRLEGVAESLRGRAYQHLRALLRSRQYHEAKLTLYAWIAGRRWRHGMTPEELAGLDRPAAAFVRRVLKQGHRRVCRRGQGIRRRTVEELHALRIASKRQRYAVEFFASLFPGKPVRAYQAALKELQLVLGLLNDGATAGRLMGELGCVSGMQDAVEFVLGWTARGQVDAREHLRDTWKAFQRRKTFWKKQRKTRSTNRG